MSEPTIRPGDDGGAAPAAVPRPRPRRWRWLVGFVLLLLVLLCVAAAMVVSGLKTEAGTRRALDLAHRLSGGMVVVTQPAGPLFGAFSARRVELVDTASAVRSAWLTVEGLSWRDAWVEPSARQRWRFRLMLRGVQATRVVVLQRADQGPAEPAALPANLGLPFGLRADSVQVARVQVQALGERPLTEVAVADLGINVPMEKGDALPKGSGSLVHRVGRLSLVWDRLLVEGGARIALRSPYALDAQVQARPHAARPAAASASAAPLDAKTAAALDHLRLALAAAGNLKQVELSADLKSQQQALAAQAQVQPFAAMPLTRLRAQASRLDLSALSSAAPRTALSGSVLLHPDGAPALELKAAPASAASAASAIAGASASAPAASPHAEPLWALQADLRNEEAGPWDQGRLPVQAVQALAHVGGWDAGWARIDALSVLLGTPRQPAGSVSATGAWRRALDSQRAQDQATPRWQLQVQLRDLRPSLMDARAPAMRIAGPVQLQAAPGHDTLSALPMQLAARLQGEVELLKRGAAARRGEVQLELQGQAAADAVVIDKLLARASGTSAEAAGRAQLADGRWHAKGKLGLAGFDPGLWWPGWAGPPGDAAISGTTELNAQADIDLDWPQPQAVAVGQAASQAAAAVRDTARAGAASPQAARALKAGAASGSAFDELLAGLGGRAELTIAPSRVLGLAASGLVKLSGAASAPAVSLDGRIDLAGNQLQWQGQVSRRDVRGDRWSLSVDAPALDRVAPLAAATGWRELRGSLRAQSQATGRWPALHASGQVEASNLSARLESSAAPWSLKKLNGRWDVGAVLKDLQAPLTAELQAEDLSLGNLQVSRLEASSTGSAREHRVKLKGAAQLNWAAAPAAGASSAAGTPAAKKPAVRGKPRDPVRLRLALDGAGGFTPAGGGGGSGAAEAQAWGWAGSVRQVEVLSDAPLVAPKQPARPLPAAALPVAASAASGAASGPTVQQRAEALAHAPWLRAENLAFQLRQTTQTWSMTMQPARIESLGASLRIQHLHWQVPVIADGIPDASADLDIRADLEPIAVAPLLALIQPDAGWDGDLTVGGSLRWRHAPGSSEGVRLQAELARRSGDLTISESELEGGNTLKLNLSQLRVGVEAENGIWRMSQQVAGRSIGSIDGKQVLRTDPHALWPDAETPLEGQLDLQIANLRAWGSWLTVPGWRLSGKLQAQAKLGGTMGAPEYTGSLRGEGLGAANLLEGVDLRDGELAVSLQGPVATIDKLVLKGGAGGELAGGGRIMLGASPQASLRVQATRFALLHRVDRRIVASGDATLELDEERIALDGRFALDDGLFDITRSEAPALGDDVVVIRRDGSETSTDTEEEVAQATPRRVELKLQIALADKLRLKGRGLDTMLGGDLVLTNPGGRLSLNGVVNTVSGTYAAYGQKLAIDRGAIVFTGQIANPRLDIQASREQSVTASTTVSSITNEEVRVGVIITGTAQYPRVRLFSEPEMSETEKLSWLVLGRGSSGLAGSDVTLLQGAAAALLSGDDGENSGNFANIVGLDELSVRQSDGDVHDTIVSVGKQVSRSWYLGYERGLNATTGTWRVIYRLAKRFTLRAESGADNSLDLIWSFRWR